MESNDWITTDTDMACPAPHCVALFRISRTGTRTFKDRDVSAAPLPGEG